MTTPHPQHAADALGESLGFPGVPEDAPEELDGPPARREEALATSSEAVSYTHLTLPTILLV